MSERWNILRVYGQAHKAETAITDLGGEAYWPHKLIRRRNRRTGPDRGAIVEQRVAVVPGYMFMNASLPVSLERIPEAILQRSRSENAALHNQGEDQRPRTVGVSVTYLTFPDGTRTYVPACLIVDLRKAVKKHIGGDFEAIVSAFVDMIAGIEKVRSQAKIRRGRPVFDSFGDATKLAIAS